MAIKRICPACNAEEFEPVEGSENQFKCVYCGTVTTFADVEEVIPAVEEAKEEIKEETKDTAEAVAAAAALAAETADKAEEKAEEAAEEISEEVEAVKYDIPEAKQLAENDLEAAPAVEQVYQEKAEAVEEKIAETEVKAEEKVEEIKEQVNNYIPPVPPVAPVNYQENTAVEPPKEEKKPKKERKPRKEHPAARLNIIYIVSIICVAFAGVMAYYSDFIEENIFGMSWFSAVADALEGIPLVGEGIALFWEMLVYLLPLVIALLIINITRIATGKRANFFHVIADLILSALTAIAHTKLLGRHISDFTWYEEDILSDRAQWTLKNFIRWQDLVWFCAAGFVITIIFFLCRILRNKKD